MEVRDPDGRAGYPGTVTARVTYHLLPEGVLAVRYEATG